MTHLGFAEFVWLWNDRQGLGMPEVHDRIACWLEERWRTEERRLLLMAFRGCGKSTLVGLFAAWLLACDPSLRILVLAADLTLAKKMVRTVKRMIERHPVTVALALKPPRADLWGAEQFTVRRPLELRDPSMLARGIGANLTGSRADVIICDDVEVPNSCDTAPKRLDLRTRLGEIDYILVPGGMQLYVGTPHTYYTIYAAEPRREVGETAIFLEGFRRLEIPLLDARGRSVWPQRFADAAIARIRRHTGANKFQSQMLLQPMPISAARLDPDRMTTYEGELEYREAHGRAVLRLNGRTLVSASAWWDPAYGANGNGGDGSVVAVVFGDGEGHWYLHRIAYLTVNDPAGGERGADGRDDGADAATQQCQAVARFVRALHLPALGLEINGLGRFLPGLLRRELARAGIACAVVEHTSRQPKALRIAEAFDAVLAAGALSAHRGVWDTPFIQEMRDWRPDARFKGHDDGLDAVAACLKAEPVRLGTRPPAAPRPLDWRTGATPVQADSSGWSV